MPLQEALTSPAKAGPGGVRAAAAALMAREAWDEAAGILSACAGDPRAGLEFNLARNLAALRRHKPDTYQALLTLLRGETCRITTLADGWFTLFQTDAISPTSPWVSLSPHGDPRRGLAEHQKQITPTLTSEHRFALCGLGDGYVLGWLATNRQGPAALEEFGWGRTLYILEPDGDVVMGNLMIHDWSGPGGSIAQDRCRWFVGPGCVEAYRTAMQADALLCLPTAMISQGTRGAAVSQAVERVHTGLVERDRQTQRRLDAHYAGVPAAQLAALFGEHPPRTPRILVITSQFSKVLQHSARDTADAFEKLGWESRLLIEPTSHHGLNKRAIRRSIEQFLPDAAFNIDHLRVEMAGVSPAELPFICWVQDDFPNLTQLAAGRSITRRDFVLTCAEGIYARDYGYPLRQSIHVQKLTRVPARPARWESEGDDLVYVSNASPVPARLLEKLVGESTGAAADLMRQCGERMISLYAAGGAIATRQQLGWQLNHVERAAGLSPLDDDARLRLISKLFDTLNNALYRQQGLRWLAGIARDMGLRLSVYGAGWEQNPEFAAHARGAVAYGAELEDLTRRSRINLQIVPFSSLHQRLLDGWVAGGFFLIRRHEVESLWYDLGNVFAQLPAGVDTTDAARQVLPETERTKLDSVVARLTTELDEGPWREDLITALRRFEARGLASVFTRPPRFDEVCFKNAAEARRLVNRFLADPSARECIAAEQRRYVESHFTYEAGMKRVTRAVGRLIATEGELPAQLPEAVAQMGGAA